MFSSLRQERRQFKLALNDFFVEGRRVGVLEWQVAADHGVKNDSARPNVRFQPMVLLAAHHLGSRVAGRPARGVEQLPGLVAVAQTEVDNWILIML